MTGQPKRVLFVCIGNSCRSQMAEAFARAYGADVLVPASAGIHPAMSVAPDTIRAMSEKHLDLRDHFPKGLRQVGRQEFDVVINMTGSPLPAELGPSEEWDVPDPILLDYEEHCEIRDKIERLVMKLILELREHRNAPQFRGFGSGRLKL